MEVDLGQKVLTADGEELGTVSRVILDQTGQQVNSVVVESGLLVKDAFEIPPSAFIESEDGTARVSFKSSETEALSRFDADRYEDAPPHFASPFGFPAGGVLWPGAAPIATAPYGQGVYPVAPIAARTAPEGVVSPTGEPDERWEIERLAEQANAVIERGSDVVTSDGEKIGEVDSVSFDPQTGRPTTLLVRRGFLFTEDIEIPAAAIASVDDEVVTLKADKERVNLWSRDETVLLF